MKLFFLSIVIFSCVQLTSQVNNPFDIPDGGERVGHSAQNDSLAEMNMTPIVDQSVLADTLFGNEASYPDPQDVNPFDKNPSKIITTQSDISKENVSANNDSLIPGSTQGVVLVYSLVMLIILTLAISMDKNRFNSMMKSCVNSNYLKTLYRDNKAWTNGQGIVLYVFFWMNASFLSWLLLIKSDASLQVNLFIIGGLIFGCYMVRHFVLWVISTVFTFGNELNMHNFSIGLHNMILGVLLLPIIVAVEFLPIFSYQSMLFLAAGVVLIIYTLRQVKGIFSCISMRGFNPFYFFIYLCAIEIAPVLVVFKMMNGAL